jgi:DNA modification methylase
MGTLYYGDNLDILRRYLKDETVDLVYLDPPFNSAQNYNAFFHEKDGTDAASVANFGLSMRANVLACARRIGTIGACSARSVNIRTMAHGANGCGSGRP